MHTKRFRLVGILLAACLLAVQAGPAAAAKARTRLVSKTSSGVSANDQAINYGHGRYVSENGRFVVFESNAGNLPKANTHTQIYLHDRKTARTYLISKTNKGQVGSGGSYDPAISTSGRFIAFDSQAANLPRGGQGTGFELTYVHDRKTKKTKLVSKNNQGQAADSYSYRPSISGNGRFVAFNSRADNLPGANGQYQVFVHDVETGKTQLISKNNQGQASSSAEFAGPALTDSGRHVIFLSNSANLPGGGGGITQVYVHDRKTKRTILVSKASGGAPSTGTSASASISGDGRFVTFDAYNATNLPGGAGKIQVYVHDRKTKKTNLVSKASSGQPGQNDSFASQPSRDGRMVSFQSKADNLPGHNDDWQIYVHDRKTKKTNLVSKNPQGQVANRPAYYPSMSPDGGWVVFGSNASNLPGYTGQDLVYLRGPIG